MPDTEVPAGTSAEVLGWVDGDPQRAQTALEAETCKDNPRSTLVAKLEAIAAKEQPVSEQTTSSDPNEPAATTTSADEPAAPEQSDETAASTPDAGADQQPDDASAVDEREDTTAVVPSSDPDQPSPDVADDGDFEQAPGPEEPDEIEIRVEDHGTVVFPAVLRDPDVDVDEEALLTPALVGPAPDERDEGDPITGDQVEWITGAADGNGLVLVLNGQGFALNKGMIGALKQIVDKTVVATGF